MCMGVLRRCCNTCDDVREAYRHKGWAFTSALDIEQCKRDGYSDKFKQMNNEGCRVYGYLQVNKVLLVLKHSHTIQYIYTSFIVIQSFIGTHATV